MRILVSTDQWYPDLMGGIARVAADTARRWARAGHDVVVLAPEQGGMPREEFLEDGALRLLRVLPRGRLPQTLTDALATRRWSSHLAVEAIDVVVAHTPTTAYGTLTSRLEAPVVYVYHADAARESRYLRTVLPRFGREWLAALALERPLRRMDLASLRAAQAVIVLSEFSRGLLAELAPPAAGRAVLIEGAVDTERFNPVGRVVARERLGVARDARLVLTVRRLVPRMGLEQLLDAAGIVRDVAGLQLAIAGSGSLATSLRARADRLRAEDRVRFLGRVPEHELPLWYRAADLFVLPTTAYEGFGLVTAEALASGTPVVGTPIGATPELLRPLDPRLVTTGTTSEEIAAGIRLGLELATPTMRERCRAYALERYAWNVALPQWTRVLEDAIYGRREPVSRGGARSSVLHLGSLAIRRSGAPFVARRVAARNRAGVLVYHDPTARALADQLEILAKGHAFVPYDILIDALRGGDWGEVPPKALAVTFDDGHRGNASLTPVFETLGVVPTIFLCASLVGTDEPFWWTANGIDREALKRVPNAERLRRLAELPRRHADREALSTIEIQSLARHARFAAHTRSHPILTMCTDEEAEDEIVGSKIDVERLTGERCLHFAYPNGAYGARELELVRRAGYRSARTIEPGWVAPTTDPYRVPIVPMPDTASSSRAVSQIAAVTFARPLLVRRHRARSARLG